MRKQEVGNTKGQEVGRKFLIGRSEIHGRGVYYVGANQIESGEVLLAYSGELIRSSVTDRREKYYDRVGMDCFMFRLDNDYVIDATMKGSVARFINHSCEPNCHSKVIQGRQGKKIVIISSRKISWGEELTYNYKFPIEHEKIACNCGRKRCKKYLN